MRKQPPEPMQAKLMEDHPFFDLVEKAYRVFAYPKPTTLGVCEGCCLNPKIEADFFGPPIRELPLRYVQNWYQGAYSTDGVPKSVWVYLIPRILEILACGKDVSNVAIEVSLKRFDTGNPENWSEAEWRILDSFQKLFLRETMELGGHCLDDILCMFHLAGWTLESLLDQVASAPNSTLARCLWNDWCREAATGHESIWITAFWEKPQNKAVLDFYTSRSLYERMEAVALDDKTEGQLALNASAVASVIEAHANWS